MILVDSSVWIDHLRAGDKTLATLLDAGRVMTHPFIIGELALGNLGRRDEILGALTGLPRASAATDTEVLDFIGRNGLFGLSIGYVDAHLLAATRLTGGSVLWTRDKRFHRVAVKLGLAGDMSHEP